MVDIFLKLPDRILCKVNTIYYCKSLLYIENGSFYVHFQNETRIDTLGPFEKDVAEAFISKIWEKIKAGGQNGNLCIDIESDDFREFFKLKAGGANVRF